MSSSSPQTQPLPQPQGVILVDHGSRREESNQQLEEMVRVFASAAETAGKFEIVEPAHMELASPSIADAFANCVKRGAKSVIVFPYFLAPGRHWREDIPRLAAEAADGFPGIPFVVTAPLGPHPAMATIIHERISDCLARQVDPQRHCELCQHDPGCVAE